jgi:hypothetical protein
LESGLEDNPAMIIVRSLLHRGALACGMVFFASLTPPAVHAQPIGSTDLARHTPQDGLYRRVLGSVGNGASGVPVAGGFDMDDDGELDYAIAAMRAAPQGRFNAGQVFLVFGDGRAAGEIDTAQGDPRVLEIHGDQVQENAGSEIWMADVTGNGQGDLIICRQNYNHDDRIGAGALTLIPASPRLRTMAAEGTVLDLRTPPPDLPLLNVYGAMEYSRLCIWARNGDVNGDGIDDLVIGADRESSHGDENAGAVYLIRGGAYLEGEADIDLAQFGSVSEGNLARIKPRPGSAQFHLGATVATADLDGNGRTEVLAAAALARAGASLSPAGGLGKGSGGTANGTLFIVWDDNFAGDWMPAPDFVFDEGPGSYSLIDGSGDNENFGEEILGGLDFDNDGSADLFVGDLTSDGISPVDRFNAGLAHVIYDAATLRNLEFDLEPDSAGEPGAPEGFSMASFIGPYPGGIAGDTALQGDFNDDGIADVAFSSPHDQPFGRQHAGTLHIALGKNGKWPEVSDLKPENYPSPDAVQMHEIYGARGTVPGSVGDVLCYSGASADITGDGVPDLLINEMQGDGSEAADVGNLLIIDSKILFRGQRVFGDGFETP